MTLGLIMNPMNGEIYSLAVNPTFDPNTYGSQSDIKIFSNPARKAFLKWAQP